ncbi:hypothetical protein C1645_829441 [Glomus cerebriforme]|uniref:F-box domain-containing protein n=1 Tax=Glomus cerebriforme TaxID=658196 RepID=A0A397SN46_9GLOM|nr:hypothetical protein C1645_829441 [Glomus cerebriforme]
MICSKIFSEELPELINEIIKYFQNDFSTLHSCILVNRLWCHLAIPLLWADSFLMKLPKNYHFIEIYLHNLNDIKTKLGEYGINNNTIPSTILFNYPKYCKKIKFFYLLGFNNQDIYPIFDLIKNIKQNLNYLTIDFCKLYDFHNQLNYDINLSSIILLNLGKILPIKLEYLNLTLMFNINNFEIFLKDTQDIFINKLLIRNKISKNSKDILPYIKKSFMKEKRINYLAFEEVSSEKNKSLVFSEDEILEFELYNIKVLDYYELSIDCFFYIKEMY